MLYPVMTESTSPTVGSQPRDTATLAARWRSAGLAQAVPIGGYHDADVLAFEQRSAQHLMTMLGIERDFKPEVPEAAQGLDAKAEDNYFTAKEMPKQHRCRSTFSHQAERNRKRVRHLMRVGNLRFSLPAILAWEIANSVRGNPAAATVEEIEIPTNPLSLPSAGTKSSGAGRSAVRFRTRA